ncbi:MAG: Transcriptional regulator, ArsR family [Candidatus Saccharibacteria bacterium]|nr:Transcriptional regulator, ArsR family [Candidatus Saccharibacteria bacterium]
MSTATEEKLPRIFAALGDSTRYQIMELLMRYPDICVSNLAFELDLSVSAVSQQCKLLELNGLVRRVRKGQQICYQVRRDDPLVRSILSLVKET